MKKILLSLSLILLTVFARAQQGLENIIVEKYYVSDANDAAGAVGNGDNLPVGSVTYRIFVDMLPGYKFQAAFGTQNAQSVPLHTLKIMTTTSFYNNTDRGHEIPSFSKTNAAQNTTMLDSYFSAGAACANSAGPIYNYGILKSDDGAAGGTNVVNANGLLQNNDPSAGAPLTTADGIYGVSSPVVSSVTFVNMAQAQSDFDAGPSASSFITSNSSWASLAGVTGPTADNRVLIGQFTTDGCFHFELNIQIGTPAGGVQKYVAAAPTGSEILFAPCIYPPVATNTASVSIAPSPVVPLCAGSTITFAATPALGGASPSYQWKKNNVNDGTNSATYTTTVASGDVITCVLTSNQACVYGSPATSNSITVLPPPVVTAGNVSGCAGSAIALSGSPAGGNFSVANPYTGPGTTYTYSYTDGNGCSATSAPANITVNPLPTVSFTGLAPSYNVSAAAATLTGSPAGGTFSGPGISGNTFTPSAAGVGGPYTITYSYTDGNGCSNTASQQVSVTNCAAPSTPGPISGQSTVVCAGSSHTYIIANVSGLTYNWIAPANATVSSGQGTNSVTVNFLAGFTSGSLKVNASNACGNSGNRTLALSSVPSTPGVISGQSAVVCAGSSHTYIVANVAGVTYNWTAPANATIASGQGTNSVTVNFLAGFTSGTLAVNASNACGNSGNRTLGLKSVPSMPGVISGQSTVVCAGSSHAYSVVNVAGVTYNWTAPANATIASGQGTNSVTVNFLAGFTSGTLTVNASNACGNSGNRTLALKSVPTTPGVISGQSTLVCAGSSHTYSIANVSGLIYNWTAPANATIASGQGTNSVTINFLAGFTSGTLKVNASNACGNSGNRTLALSSIPATPGVIIGTFYGLCGLTNVPYSVANVAGVTYNWTVPTGAVITNGQGTNAITVDFSASVVSGYVKVSAGNACGNSAFRSAAVKTTPVTPGMITGNTSVTSCVNESYSISAISGAASYTWTVPSGSSIISGQGTTGISVDFGSTSGNISVKGVNACGSGTVRYLSITVSGCTRIAGVNGDETMDATVYPNPSSGDFTIAVRNASDEKTSISVIDATGRMVQNMVSTTANSEVQISNLLPGVYSAIIINGENKKVLKLIKVN
ncbi:MAG TPA: T9SS type A sorting domain-containing protein [Bacteroidia bacterium]|nr:T9SS type A sorting domain-containing protein [Bacteroidia bacterium]